MKINKQTALTVALAVALLLALIFGILYGNARSADRNRTNELCAFYMESAYGSIVKFGETGTEMYFSAAVTDFYAFIQLHFYEDDVQTEYTNANELYWKLQASPVLGHTYLVELTEIFALLKDNPYSPGAYQKIASLNSRFYGAG